VVARVLKLARREAEALRQAGPDQVDAREEFISQVLSYPSEDYRTLPVV